MCPPMCHPTDVLHEPAGYSADASVYAQMNINMHTQACVYAGTHAWIVHVLFRVFVYVWCAQICM